ncbi:hypothetical protein EYF80_064096 [Liparis tanakae]|uniref:Uncharacterized protein n=1 Tax=Liparis tanakae TaxID=230148 RepID=A0A4Z2EBV1_9TELE|nr:hypothetical protein EYF80_064096 [Liparis tanakae]
MNLFGGGTKPKADYYPSLPSCCDGNGSSPSSHLAWYGMVHFDLTCQSPQEETPQLLLPLRRRPVLSSCQVKNNMCMISDSA